MKYQKYLSTLRATRLLLLVAIRLAVSGQWTLVMKCKYLKVTKMKYSLAHSTMKVILSLLDLKITHAEYGKINMLLRESKNLKLKLSEDSN